MPDWVDFKKVKSRVSMAMLTRRYGLELRKVNATYLRGDCPLPQHGEGSKNSFVVNTEKSVWSCQSRSCADARKGKKGGNVLDFVSWMERCSIRDAAVTLSQWFCVSSAAPQSSETPPSAPPAPEVVNPPLAFSLKDIQFAHAYLASRGFEEEECEYLGVGFFPGRGMMKNRIVFPVHNERGELVAYSGRSTDGAEPRWVHPPGFAKAEVVYNLHRALADDWIEVFVFESFWSVLACARAGIMNAVAVMGCRVSESQAKLLSGFQRVVVVFDGDRDGREGTVQAVEAFSKAGVPRVETALLPEGKQPDDFGPDELREFLGLPLTFPPYIVVEDQLPLHA